MTLLFSYYLCTFIHFEINLCAFYQTETNNLTEASRFECYYVFIGNAHLNLGVNRKSFQFLITSCILGLERHKSQLYVNVVFSAVVKSYS